MIEVALREEGVDRNHSLEESALPLAVALREEGVDRNGLLGLSGRPLWRRPPRGGRG